MQPTEMKICAISMILHWRIAHVFKVQLNDATRQFWYCIISRNSLNPSDDLFYVTFSEVRR